MVFSTLTFVYFFLPVCLILYFLVPGIRAKNTVLLVMSLIFYAWGEPVWIVLMVLTALVNYLCGLAIGRAETRRKKRAWAAASIAVSLGALAVFKYTGFVIENLNLIPGVAIPAWKLTLPIGISFYTFQALSYTIDVCRGNTAVQRSYPDFLLYVSLFPQLIAGPIVRYSDVAAEITSRRATLQDFTKGATRFLTGLAKKLLLANFCGELIEKYIGTQTALGGWVGLCMFAFQIYFDFSGYSDMAIGLGRMLGFHFKENFDYPYCCDSITSFWRRWHISLSSFFRDYVYIPLGGNRRHAVLNLFLVWALPPPPHGASWNFILWGLYFGTLLALEKYVLRGVLEKTPRLLRRIGALFLVLMGWALFYFEDMSALGTFLGQLFGATGRFSSAAVGTMLLNNVVLIPVCILVCTPVGRMLHALNVRMRRTKKLPMHLAAAATLGYDTVLMAVCTVVMVSSTYNPFLYFRF